MMGERKGQVTVKKQLGIRSREDPKAVVGQSGA